MKVKGVLLVLACFVFGCSSPRVVYDFDSHTNFSTLKTYAIYNPLDTGLSDLDTKRLLEVLNASLANLGFKHSNNPDFYINVTTKKLEVTPNSQVGVGVGGTGRNVGGGVSVGIPLGSNMPTTQFTFDVVDASTNQLIWQAIAEHKISEKASPDTKKEQLKIVVNAVFKNFPPSNK